LTEQSDQISLANGQEAEPLRPACSSRRQRAVLSVLTDFGRILRLLRASGPRLALVSATLTLLEVAFGIAALYMIKLLVDVLSPAAGTGVQVGFDADVFLYLGLAAVTLLLAVVVQSLGNLARTAQGLRVGEYVDHEIHDRAIAIDLEFYESPLFYDSLQRARQAGIQRPAKVIDSLLLSVKSIIFLVAVLVMIAAIDWRIVPGLLFAVLPVFAVRMRYTRRLFDWHRDRVQFERRAGYLDFLMTSNIFAKEIRIGGLGRHLQAGYAILRARINREQLSIEKWRAATEFAASIAGTLVFVGATAWLVLEATAGRRSIGDLVLFVLLFRRAEGSGREFVSNMAQLYDHRLYIRQLFEFLSVRSRIKRPAEPRPIPKGDVGPLVFDNVDLTYPGAQRPVLTSVSFSLKPGQVVALVGANGSGKTSLVKLLTRLYDPSAGRITLGGTDIREFDPDAYRRLFSVVFQDYAKYADTVRENIRYGNLDDPSNDAEIVRAARFSGADGFIERLRSGYDTRLTRMFDDGEEISIGQWQKLALARAFFASSSFIVMDEPSSALDPQAEQELFDDFRDRIDGRGALIISHRLSTVRMADYTYVLENERIIEHGNHDGLMAAGGRYASLFRRQGRHYRDAE
jgi:ATP-binding cassette subfamily B protein